MANKTVRGSGIGLAVADEIIKQHKGAFVYRKHRGSGHYRYDSSAALRAGAAKDRRRRGGSKGE